MTAIENGVRPSPDARSQAGTDPALRLLVAMINSDPDNSIDLTLTVQGALITGSAICNTRWLRDLQARFESIGGEADNASAIFGTLADRVETDRSDPIDTEKAAHIHLSDALVGSGGSWIRIGHWRARIDRVDGWSVGRHHS